MIIKQEIEKIKSMKSQPKDTPFLIKRKRKTTERL